MADVVDTVPPALDIEGNLVIWFVQTITDLTAVKAATEIGAATSFRVTHSFTPAGFNLTGSQEKLTDDRLALADVLETLGKLTRSLSLEYVQSDAAASAAVVLKPTPPATTKSGYFVVRPNLSNKTLAAASQKGQVIPVNLGPQMLNYSGVKPLFTQEAAITGPIVDTIFAA